MRKFFYTSIGTFHIEIGKLPRIALGIEFGAGDGDEIQINVGCYYQLWLSYGARWISKLWRKSREIEVDLWFRERLQDISVSVSLYGGDNNHFSSVRKYYFTPISKLLDIVLGEPMYRSEEKECDNTIFDMPEGRYLAGTKIVHRYWKRPLSPFTRSSKSVEFNFEGGIPVEGKGENSWDCGMDAYFSSSIGLEKDESIYSARDREILDILKTRMRRSSFSHYTLENLKKEGYYVSLDGFITRDMMKGNSNNEAQSLKSSNG